MCLLLTRSEKLKKGSKLGSHGTTDGVKVFYGVLNHLSGQVWERNSPEAQFRQSSI